MYKKNEIHAVGNNYAVGGLQFGEGFQSILESADKNLTLRELIQQRPSRIEQYRYRWVMVMQATRDSLAFLGRTTTAPCGILRV